MAIKVYQVESELNLTKRLLESTENQLQNEIQDKKKIIIAKDEIIDDLKQKINNIQMTYDSVIQLTLDKFNQNLNLKKLEWENNSTRLQTKNKTLLAELGLKIHDI
jgi:CRISPR/Cas system CMR subunit Cmr6 (Cas7 group RAMP superfamily)